LRGQRLSKPTNNQALERGIRKQINHLCMNYRIELRLR
jgi:hypothetical protein